MTRPLTWLAAVVVAAVGFVGTASLPGAHGEESRKKPVDFQTMNLPLLEENLLKIWIVEESSDLYNQARIAQKSFEGLIPVEPTGDAELDAKNREEQKQLNFELTHFLKLELDGAIQVVDILRRVLGKQPRLDPKAKELKEFLGRDVPTIKWRWLTLDRALQDMGAKLGIRVELKGVPVNTKLEVNLHLEGAAVAQLIDFLLEQHNMEWTYSDKVLTFSYIGKEE